MTGGIDAEERAQAHDAAEMDKQSSQVDARWDAAEAEGRAAYDAGLAELFQRRAGELEPDIKYARARGLPIPNTEFTAEAYRRVAHVLRTAPQMEKALEACRKYIPGSMVRSWPPGHRLRDEALKSSADALAAYREGK